MLKSHLTETPLRINSDRLLRTINDLSQIGKGPGGGITRLTFSPEDVKARKYVSDLMEKSGLKVSVDQFANVVGLLDGTDHNLPVVMTGSHIDTVPNAGPLDGAYGVLSAIEAVRRIREEEVPIKNSLCVIIFTEEEGSRFPAYLGSRGFVNALTRKGAYSMKDKNGVSFEQAMARAGTRQTELKNRIWKPGNVKCYVELHIEQGPILEKKRSTIGVVESIVGNVTTTVLVQGVSGHAGTMQMSSRRDALVGASKMILGINEIAKKMGTSVATVGSISIAPNASNVVPGEVSFSVDFRDDRVEKLRVMKKGIISLLSSCANEYDLRIRTQEQHFTKPAKMSRKVIHVIANSAQSLGLRNIRINSGAGHDCQNLSGFTETGMIFIPSRDGVSHAPEEYSDPRDIAAGANVLLNSLTMLSGGATPSV